MGSVAESTFVGVVLLVMLVLLFIGFKTPEMVVFCCLVLVWNANLLTTSQALAGYSNPGMLAVGVLFVVIKGVERSQLADRAARQVFGLKTSKRLGMLRLTSLCFFLSAFLNNTPVVALLIPVTRDWARTRGFAPSQFLIPLSFSSIFGGVLTIIGTSTNLVVLGLVSGCGKDPIGFFEPGYIGLPLGILGILYLVLVAPAILPANGGLFRYVRDRADELITEVEVQQHFKYIGSPVSLVLAALGLPPEALIKIRRPVEEKILLEMEGAATPGTDSPRYRKRCFMFRESCYAKSMYQKQRGCMWGEKNDLRPWCRGVAALAPCGGSAADGAEVQRSSVITARSRSEGGENDHRHFQPCPDGAIGSMGAPLGGSMRASPSIDRTASDLSHSNMESGEGLGSSMTGAAVYGTGGRDRAVSDGIVSDLVEVDCSGQNIRVGGCLESVAEEEPNPSSYSISRSASPASATQGNYADVYPVSRGESVQAGDVLFLSCSRNAMVDFQGGAAARKLEGLLLLDSDALNLPGKGTDFFELVLSDRNMFVGEDIKGPEFASYYGCSVVAVRRKGKRDADAALGRSDSHLGADATETSEDKLVEVSRRPLASGDVVLVLAKQDFADKWGSSEHFFLTTNVGSIPKEVRPYDYIPLLLFAAMLVWVTGFEADMVKAAFTTGALLILGGFVEAKRAVSYVNWSLLLLIGSALGLSQAIVNSGLAGYIGDGIRAANIPPQGSIFLVYAFTMICTELITNNAAAALAVPIALEVADTLGVSCKPFAIAVMMAASSSFITPIGYQTNTMVWGPGGYTFSDFAKIGLPLSIMYMVLSCWLIPLIFPF